jgi:hypothetical protein
VTASSTSEEFFLVSSTDELLLPTPLLWFTLPLFFLKLLEIDDFFVPALASKAVFPPFLEKNFFHDGCFAFSTAESPLSFRGMMMFDLLRSAQQSNEQGFSLFLLFVSESNRLDYLEYDE